jgi:hypothetical protein
MEIHSSSLRFIPVNENPRKNNNTRDSSTQSKKDAPQNKTTLAAPRAEAIATNNFETRTVQNLTDDIEKQKNTSTNSRNSHALNLYVQESTQLLQKQRSDLISNIDFFI